MRFERIEIELQKCEEHLDIAGARNTEIESCFVQYLLIRICAEYETRIALLVKRRCSRMRDSHIKSFTHRGAKDACKYFNIGDIKGILGRFGQDYKDAFHDQVMNTRAHVSWDNIYTNRNLVAHGSGAQMSFPDLKTDYTESLAVLDALVGALGLTPREIKDLT